MGVELGLGRSFLSVNQLTLHLQQEVGYSGPYSYEYVPAVSTVSYSYE